MTISLRMTESPTVPRGRATGYELCPLFAYSTGKLEGIPTFSGCIFSGGGVRGQGSELRGRIFPWRNLSWGKRISMKGILDFLA